MNEVLVKRLRLLYLGWLVASVLALVLAVAGSLTTSIAIHDTIATRALEDYRSDLLNGDIRRVVLGLGRLTPVFFEAITVAFDDGRPAINVVAPDSTPTQISFNLPHWRSCRVVTYDPKSSAEALAKVCFDFVPGYTLVVPLVAWLLLFAISIPLIRRYRNRMARDVLRELEHARLRAVAEKDAAIARMTQMLAHDVRKPFSILRIGMGMLAGAQDAGAVQKVLTRLIPEVDKAVGSVDGLIADVMEIGSTSSELIQEPATPESLVEYALTETFRAYPKSDVSISYSFEHTRLVSVHVAKINRVFANIVSNAVQAMGCRGELWVKTRDADGYVEFCVGNAGSYIPPEHLPRLFEAFFTSGKKGGTGLGLAIAHKMVTAHGGRIWCQSAKTPAHPEGQVEFFFTLPAAKDFAPRIAISLPRQSSAFAALMQPTAMTLGDPTEPDPVERSLEEEVAGASSALGRPLQVLVVDDEAVYRSALVAFLARPGTLASAVMVREANSVDAAMQELREAPVDLIITDVDMGRDTGTGFELVRSIRSSGIQALVCVHSNRVVAADHAKAIEVGADAFVPKPMARAQMLRLLLQAADRRPRPSATTPTKPEVLIVDDNAFVLEAWERCISSEATVHTVTSVKALRAKLQAQPDLMDRLMCVVTDLYLDDETGDGTDVARIIKAARSDIPVHLSSDGNLSLADLGGAIDSVIGKDPMALVLLQKLVASNHQT